MVNIEELDKLKIIEFLTLQQIDNKFVITPINLLKRFGFPVSEHKFILENKTTISKLKTILSELEESGILKKRKSKQDFKGIKEVGYDYV